MARTALAAQVVTPEGVAPTYSTPSTAGTNNGHNVPLGSKLHVKYSNGATGAPASVNLTIVSTARIDGLKVADRTVNVANGAEKLVLLRGPYADENGNAGVDYDAVTGVSVAAFQQG